MKRHNILLFIFNLLFSLSLFAQESLPRISLKSFNGKVVVSWLNDFDKPITDIFIQRSFDSTRNFSTIGSVLIPQNKENGYPDNTAPYDHMYYRVSIVFEDGTYIVGPPLKPSRFYDDMANLNVTDTSVKSINGRIIGLALSYPKKKDSVISVINKEPSKNNIVKPVDKKEISLPDPAINAEALLKNTASLVLMNRFSQLNIRIPDTGTHQYQMKVFDENDQLQFEIKKLIPEGFVLEKYNFRKAGNYSFEIYEDGKLWRKNRFVINREARK